jgi:NAD(P)-dependent dehydrogenase (short-subunit alcohol dehydrogenase family)
MTEKVAIVTAAGKGMGAAIARQLGSESYQLALLSNSGGAEELAAEIGGLGFTGSVTDVDVLSDMVTKTLDTYGRIDVVVNNTGHPPKGDLLEIPDSVWLEGFDLILLNVIRMARLVTPSMLKLGGGAIVNVSAFAAVQPDLGFPVSSTLRATLGNFAKLFGDRYASSNVRMNNILPGFVDSYPVSEDIVSKIPAGRYGTVDEIASTVSFLVSEGAAYITGQSLRVDGGLVKTV